MQRRRRPGRLVIGLLARAPVLLPAGAQLVGPDLAALSDCLADYVSFPVRVGCLREVPRRPRRRPGGLPSRGAAAAAAAAWEPNTIQKRTRSHRQERRRSPWPKSRRGTGRKTALPASPTNPAGGSGVSSDHPKGRRTGPTRRPPRIVHAAPGGGRPRHRQDTLSRPGKRLFCLSTKRRVASGNPPSGGEVLTLCKRSPPPLPSLPPALVGPARKGSKNGGTHFLKRRPFLRGTRRAPASTTQSDHPPRPPHGGRWNNTKPTFSLNRSIRCRWRTSPGPARAGSLNSIVAPWYRARQDWAFARTHALKAGHTAAVRKDW